MALGAKIELWSNIGYQYIEHFLTRGYASSVDPVVHFGLLQAQKVDSLRITWPSTNNITVMKNLEANQTIEIDENSGVPAARVMNSVKALLFERDTNLINYSHIQNDYADFFLNQTIIPHKFSQIGPVWLKAISTAMVWKICL
jgi:hypothetical protein